MKALHVWERIFHYVKVWAFVAAIALLAWMAFGMPAVLYDEEGEIVKAIDLEVLAQVFGFAIFPLFAVGGAIGAWVLEHIFKKVQVIRGKDKAACKCECSCGCADAQVEKIMKWKDLYNEGIITEKEFIVKRNEILGLHK